ncbi:MAG: N-acetylmuramoyl-L-alanine amidase [Gammaproteobacteria bacterium]|nr:N-acetylmuramoyl-L-alanine amidase [Gammaproteobacteria bacterium]
MKPGSLVTCRSVLARWLGGALLALAAGVAAAASPGVVARDVRLESTPEGTQAVIELSGKASHHLFTLDNPHRVVIDVRNAVLRPGVRLPQGAGPIRSIRAGAQAGSTLRLVFDLESKMPARASLTSSGAAPGYRLLVDFGAEPAATPVAVVATHAPADSGRDIVVAIDAGHGGADPGAIGHAGTREKDVVLAIARRLAARIDAEPGMRAILTRDGDYYIAHRERIRRARPARPTSSSPSMLTPFRSARSRGLPSTCSPSAEPPTKRPAGSPSARTPRT